MQNIHDIKNRIDGVKSTKQITRAMYLISAAKSKKSKQILESTRSYFARIRVTMAEILSSSKDIDSIYITPSKRQKPLLLVLTGDKGMAGGYNANIINLCSKMLEEEPNATLWVAGFMGRSLMLRKGLNVDKSFNYPVMNPNVFRAREIADLIVEKYNLGLFDEVRIIYTQMLTPLKQEPTELCLLPFSYQGLTAGMEDKVDPEKHLTIYEPGPLEVFEHLTPKYLKGMIYSALVEAYTSEQNARMITMDNATSSANDMIEKLSLLHNRARQAAITQEITEIVSAKPKN